MTCLEFSSFFRLRFLRESRTKIYNTRNFYFSTVLRSFFLFFLIQLYERRKIGEPKVCLFLFLQLLLRFFSLFFFLFLFNNLMDFIQCDPRNFLIEFIRKCDFICVCENATSKGISCLTIQRKSRYSPTKTATKTLFPTSYIP